MEFMGLNVFFLHVLGMYSVKNDTSIIIKILLQLWRIVGVLSFFSLGTLCLLDIYYRDEFVFVDISSNILNTGIYMGGISRICYFYIYDKEARALVEEMNAVFRTQSETGFEERTMNSYQKFLKYFVWTWSIVVFFTGQFTALLPLAFIKQHGKAIPIQSWYPYDWHRIDLYVITMLHQMLTQFFMGFAYGNPDMFYVTTLHLSAGQFKLIGWELRNIIYTALLQHGIPKDRVVAFSKTFNDIGAVGRMEEDLVVNMRQIKESGEYKEILDVVHSEDFEKTLHGCFVKCIRHHQKLLNFCQTLYDFSSPMMLPNLMFNLFYVIFIAFTLVVSTDARSMMGLFEYILVSLLEIFFYAHYGAMLTAESEQLGDDLYASPWYICRRKFRSVFKYIHFRVSKPVVIKAGGYFLMGYDIFIAICKTSASYIAVLRQVTEETQ